jgi:hypothetical protein
MDSREAGASDSILVEFGAGSIFGLNSPPPCAFALIKWLLQIVHQFEDERWPRPTSSDDLFRCHRAALARCEPVVEVVVDANKEANRYWWKTL